ncbi:MAG: hypothetical protein L3J43_03445 [Sulfurovum sp.]|nr:hypothetical protein [Sulfurovum sp.]
MLKKVSLYSAVAVTTLLMMGCSGTEKKSIKSVKVVANTNPAEVAGVKALFEQSKIKNMKDSDLVQSFKDSMDIELNGVKKISDIEKIGNKICTESGSIIPKTVTVDSKDKVTAIEKLKADQCTDGKSTVNGVVSSTGIIYTDTEKKGTLTFDEDITLSDSEHTIVLKSGGEIQGDAKKSTGIWTSESVSSFESTLNDVIFNVSGLKVKTTSDKNNLKNETIEVLEGSLNLGDYYFTIDNTKANTIEVKDKKATGTIHMKDGAGHKVELVVANNKVSANIDEDNDGSFSDNEILK